MTPRDRILTHRADQHSRRSGRCIERDREAAQMRNRLEYRQDQILKAGFLGAWTEATGEEIGIRTRAPCGASLRIGLDGPLPECGATCSCTADWKRRVKERR